MKNEILQTALKQFLKFGIREMSIQKIIEPLGISTKTVYKYFKNKEELLEEALHLYYLQQFELMENLPEGQSAVQLFFDIWYKGIETECRVNKIFFQDLQYYYPEVEIKIETTISKKIWKKFGQIIQRGIKEGCFREDLVPDVLLESLSVLYTTTARTGQFKPFRLSISMLYIHTIAVYIRGFCTPKGVTMLDEHINTLKIFEGHNISVN